MRTDVAAAHKYAEAKLLGAVEDVTFAACPNAPSDQTGTLWNVHAAAL
ncbi:hypothetical protein AWB69_08960 [Caballeronia udeis]|uniref:Uncharacterized protein n=1 Tax=Caballeronia udeis TaxID=1232866 RepID=A0A158JXT7_9BURK|nr:hypothetical protein AWB69_08960 [Caballeronia udeis]